MRLGNSSGCRICRASAKRGDLLQLHRTIRNRRRRGSRPLPGPRRRRSSAVRDQMYSPLAQVPDPYLRRWSQLMSIAVRTSVPPLDVLEPVRRAVRGSTSDQVLYQVRTMEELAKEHRSAAVSVAAVRHLRGLGAAACVRRHLRSAGLCDWPTRAGIRCSHGAGSERRKRDAARAAAEPRNDLRGVGAGAIGAFMAGRLLIRLVQGIRSVEPLPFVLMITALIAAALFASFLPARRASRVEPMSALRQE